MEFQTAAALYTDAATEATPLSTILVVLVLSLPAAALIGFWAGAKNRARVLARGGEIDMLVGETTLGAILALLGLLLAFTFGNALSISQARKVALTDEAAALGTVFLRADFLAEPGRTDLQEKLLDYTRSRILMGPGASDAANMQAFLEQTLRVQAELWPLTLSATSGATPAPIQTFVAGAMNDAIDAHLVRMQSTNNPIGPHTLYMLLATALTGLFLLGNRAGMLGRALTWRTFVFSGFLFVVMATILDTQRATQGFIRIDESPLRATIVDMEAALAARS